MGKTFDFGAEQKARKTAHEKAEQKTMKKKTVGKPDRTVLSLSITTEDKRLLQIYSLEHGQTAAATIHELIQKYCK